MLIDWRARTLLSAGKDPLHTNTRINPQLAFFKDSAGTIVQALAGALVDFIITKSALSTSQILKRFQKTEGGAGDANVTFEGTTGGDKLTASGSTATSIAVTNTTGMAAGERVRIGITRPELEVVVAQVIDATHFAPLVPVTPPATGLTVYRGYRAAILINPSDALPSVFGGQIWVYATLPTLTRQLWFKGPVDVLPAPA